MAVDDWVNASAELQNDYLRMVERRVMTAQEIRELLYSTELVEWTDRAIQQERIVRNWILNDFMNDKPRELFLQPEGMGTRSDLTISQLIVHFDRSETGEAVLDIFRRDMCVEDWLKKTARLLGEVAAVLTRGAILRLLEGLLRGPLRTRGLIDKARQMKRKISHLMEAGLSPFTPAFVLVALLYMNVRTSKLHMTQMLELELMNYFDEDSVSFVRGKIVPSAILVRSKLPQVLYFPKKQVTLRLEKKVLGISSGFRGTITIGGVEHDVFAKVCEGTRRVRVGGELAGSVFPVAACTIEALSCFQGAGRGTLQGTSSNPLDLATGFVCGTFLVMPEQAFVLDSAGCCCIWPLARRVPELVTFQEITSTGDGHGFSGRELACAAAFVKFASLVFALDDLHGGNFGVFRQGACVIDFFSDLTFGDDSALCEQGAVRLRGWKPLPRFLREGIVTLINNSLPLGPIADDAVEAIAADTECDLLIEVWSGFVARLAQPRQTAPNIVVIGGAGESFRRFLDGRDDFAAPPSAPANLKKIKVNIQESVEGFIDFLHSVVDGRPAYELCGIHGERDFVERMLRERRVVDWSQPSFNYLPHVEAALRQLPEFFAGRVKGVDELVARTAKRATGLLLA
jgi:hypothetical protein